MGNENLKSKSIQELESELKTIKYITTALATVVCFLFAVNLYGLLYLENKTVFIALMVVAISCGAILPVQLSSIKKIKNELQLREGME